MNKNRQLAYILALTFLIGCNVKAVNTEGDLIANHQNQKNEFTLITSLNQNYLNGDTIVFILSFPKAVDVTGVPTLSLNIGGSSRSASYVSGTGTTQIHFEYTVSGTDIDTDGLSVNTNVILGPGVSLLYDVDKICSTTIVVSDLSSVQVNATP